MINFGGGQTRAVVSRDDILLVIKSNYRSENRSRPMNVLWELLIILRSGTINGDSKDIDPSLRFHYYRVCLSVGDKVRWTNTQALYGQFIIRDMMTKHRREKEVQKWTDYLLFKREIYRRTDFAPGRGNRVKFDRFLKSPRATWSLHVKIRRLRSLGVQRYYFVSSKYTL